MLLLLIWFTVLCNTVTHCFMYITSRWIQFVHWLCTKRNSTEFVLRLWYCIPAFMASYVVLSFYQYLHFLAKNTNVIRWHHQVNIRSPRRTFALIYRNTIFSWTRKCNRLIYNRNWNVGNLHPVWCHMGLWNILYLILSLAI